LVDNNPDPGNGPEVTDVKLATSNAGLAAAVAGASLNIGLTIAGGAGSRVEIHMRQKTPSGAGGVTYNQLSITTNPVRET